MRRVKSPKIAVLALSIIRFSIGEGSKIATLATGVYFPTVISTYTGVDDAQTNFILMASTSPPSPSFASLFLQARCPRVLASFRISFAIALGVADRGRGTHSSMVPHSGGAQPLQNGRSQ
jgi:ABC-type nitrate/sulfonate/bicarbonate transport system permease component